MRAVLLNKTCRAEDLTISNVPVPEVKPGWVLVKIKAFGINRSEVMFRSYEADTPYIQLPRIPGIECVGEIADPSDSNFSRGQRVVALMGGMGRSFNGSYAEYALLPAKNTFSVEFDGSWEELAAIPETYFTAYGSLFVSLQLKPTETFLIRGGTSSLALTAVQLAKSIGSRVIAVARDKEASGFLDRHGADHVLIDDGTIMEKFHTAFPDGVEKVLELVGPDTLEESMKFLSYHGIICQTGILGRQKFFSNYPNQVIINELFDHIRQYHLKPVISKVFPLNDIAKAHQLMESNQARGKIVVLID